MIDTQTACELFDYNDRKYGTTTKDFDKAVSIAADLRQKLHGEFAYSGAPL